MRDYDVQDKRTLPLEVTLRGGKTQGLLGPLFLLAPIALAGAAFPRGAQAAGRGAVAGAPVLRQYRHALPDSGAAVSSRWRWPWP